MSKLQNDIWKICDDFRLYFHEKLRIAKKLVLSDTILIPYLINGIDGFAIRIQVAGQSFEDPALELNYMLKLVSTFGSRETKKNVSERKKTDSTSKTKPSLLLNCLRRIKIIALGRQKVRGDSSQDYYSIQKVINNQFI